MGGVGPGSSTRAASRRGSRLPRSRVIRCAYLPSFFDARHHRHKGVDAVDERARPRSSARWTTRGRHPRPGRESWTRPGTTGGQPCSSLTTGSAACPDRPPSPCHLSVIASTTRSARCVRRRPGCPQHAPIRRGTRRRSGATRAEDPNPATRRAQPRIPASLPGATDRATPARSCGIGRWRPFEVEMVRPWVRHCCGRLAGDAGTIASPLAIHAKSRSRWKCRRPRDGHPAPGPRVSGRRQSA